MKRPFALLGFSALAALLLGALGANAALLGGILAGLGLCALFAALLLRATKRLSARRGARAFSTFCACLCAALLTASLCLLFFADAEERTGRIEALDGERVRLRGTVLDYPVRAYHRQYYLIRAEGLTREGEPLSLPEFTLRLSSWRAFSCRPGDSVELEAVLYRFDSSGGLFSTRNSRLADGITLGGWLSGEVRVLPGGRREAAALLAELRHSLARGFERLLPGREAGLLRALLLGEREQAESSVYSDFQTVGASHFLVISGLHLSILAGLLSLLLSGLGLKRRPAALLTVLGVGFFLAVIGFPVSAVRSGVMVLLVLLSFCLGRRAEGVNSLGSAVLLICLVQPYSGGDLGLLLSAASTFGILLLAEPMTAAMGSFVRPRFLAASLSVTFSAQLMTLPVQALVFGGVSLTAPLAALLLSLPCMLLLYGGFFTALFGLLPVFSPLARLFGFFSGWLARLAMALARLLAEHAGLFLDLTRPDVLILLGFSLLLLACMLRVRHSRRALAFSLAALALFWSVGAGVELFRRGSVVSFAAAADSSCVLVMRGNRAAVLSLGGYRTGAAQELLRRNNIRRVELLCMPLRDADAREAAGRLGEFTRVERLALPANGWAGKDLSAAGVPVSYWRDGESFTVLDDVTLTVARDMRRIELRRGGLLAVVERGDAGEGEASLLFTDQEKTQINSAFTILQNDAIIDLPSPGRFLLPAGDGLYVDLFEDGSIRLRGESLAGNYGT